MKKLMVIKSDDTRFPLYSMHTPLNSKHNAVRNPRRHSVVRVVTTYLAASRYPEMVPDVEKKLVTYAYYQLNGKWVIPGTMEPVELIEVDVDAKTPVRKR